MSAVTALDGYRTFYVGRGKVIHSAQDSDTVTLCKKPVMGARLAHGPYVTCTPCAKISAAMKSDNEKGKGKSMAAKPETKTETKSEKNKRIREEVSANIERVQSLAEAGNEEAGAELLAETRALIEELPANQRKKLVAQLEEAAQAKRVEESEPSGDGVVTTLESQSIEDVPGLTDLVDKAAEQFKAGAAANLKTADTARAIAEIVRDMRKAARNKVGVPDLRGDSKAAKDAVNLMLSKALDGADPSNPDHAEAYQSLKRAYQNRMVDVMTLYVRGLDENPDEYEELYGKVKEVHPDLKPSEAVYTFFDELPGKGLPQHTRAERAALDRQKKAIEDKLSKGEITEDEADEELRELTGGEPEKDGQITARQALGLLKKVAKQTEEFTSHADGFSDEEREKIKRQMQDLASNLAAAARDF